MRQDLAAQRDAVDDRHDDVQHDEVDVAMRHVEHAQRFFGARGLEDAVPFFAQNAIGNAAGDALVVDDENRGARCWKWNGHSGP